MNAKETVSEAIKDIAWNIRHPLRFWQIDQMRYEAEGRKEEWTRNMGISARIINKMLEEGILDGNVR